MAGITIEWRHECYRIVALCPPTGLASDSPEHRDFWIVSMCTADGLTPYHWQTSLGHTPQAAIDSAQTRLDAKAQGGYTKQTAGESLDLSFLDNF